MNYLPVFIKKYFWEIKIKIGTIKIVKIGTGTIFGMLISDVNRRCGGIRYRKQMYGVQPRLIKLKERIFMLLCYSIE